MPPGAQRNAAILAAARAGELPAIEQLVRDARYNDLLVLRPDVPPLSDLASRPDDGGAMAPRQLYGIVLANWTMRHGDFIRDTAAAQQEEARRCLLADPRRDPLALAELAWHYGNFAPRDPARCAALFAEALAAADRLDPCDPRHLGLFTDLATIAINLHRPAAEAAGLRRRLAVSARAAEERGGAAAFPAAGAHVLAVAAYQRMAADDLSGALDLYRAAARLFIRAGCPLTAAEGLRHVLGASLNDRTVPPALRQELADTLVTIYAEAGARRHEAQIRWVVGTLAVRAGDWASATAAFDTARARYAGEGLMAEAAGVGVSGLRSSVRTDPPATRDELLARVAGLEALVAPLATWSAHDALLAELHQVRGLLAAGVPGGEIAFLKRSP